MKNFIQLALVLASFVLFFSSCNNDKDLTYKPNTEKPANFGDSIGVIDHFIPLTTAKNWIKNYTAFKDSISKNPTKYKDSTKNYVQTFNVAAIKKIMAIPGCAGYRIYTGLNPKTNVVSFIIFGVDKNGKNLYIKGKKGNTGINMIIPKIKQTGDEGLGDDGGLEYSQKEPWDGDINGFIDNTLNGGN